MKESRTNLCCNTIQLIWYDEDFSVWRIVKVLSFFSGIIYFSIDLNVGSVTLILPLFLIRKSMRTVLVQINSRKQSLFSDAGLEY